ncbi:hypothetical protein [Saccharothrix sp. HUAS TT1]|uniref:hypothetical protein n=1 Tax=unclassified Saccharothrix TaxID=2593673 RepID=UPI00345C275B
MALLYEELNTETRAYMTREFEHEEQSGNPYRSRLLTPAGNDAWPGLMAAAIVDGTEDHLAEHLTVSAFWLETDSLGRRFNFRQRVRQLAISEFNTWYVRGLTARLKDEGVEHCQVYRGSPARERAMECSGYEGRLFSVEAVYNGHRRRYWPTEDLTAFSIPYQSGCHHTIRRAGH